MASDLELFMEAIRLQESGNDYTIPPNAYGASGAYQFIFSTWVDAVSAAGFGGTVYATQPAYLAPPSVQDAAASQLMSTYYNQYGDNWVNVAEAWYGGPNAVGNPNLSGGPGYPTVGQYATEVIARYLALGGSSVSGVTVIIPNAPGAGTDFSSQTVDYYTNTVEANITAAKQWALALHNVLLPTGGVLV